MPNTSQRNMTTFALAGPNSIRSREKGFLHRVSNESSEDARLVARVTEGDESALEAIYRKHGRAVAFVARKVLLDDALAEDVVQDVFVSFCGSPNRFDVNRGTLRSYLLTIAHRRAVDIVRSEEARGRRSPRACSDPAPATFTWTDETTGFALTRVLAGGVVTSAGDVVSVITDA